MVAEKTPAKKAPTKKASTKMQVPATDTVDAPGSTRSRWVWTAVSGRFQWTDRKITLAFALAGMLLGGLVAMTAAGLGQGRDNEASLNETHELLEIVKDSVEPDGKRYQRGQAQTAAAVSTINEITILAAHCAKKHDDLVEIKICVQVEYERMRPATTPTTAP